MLSAVKFEEDPLHHLVRGINQQKQGGFGVERGLVLVYGGGRCLVRSAQMSGRDRHENPLIEGFEILL